MATSNFYYYDNLPNLYFKTIDELLNAAYYYGLDEDEEQEYFDEECSNYRVLDEYKCEELKSYIEEMNCIITDKANSYKSDRQTSYEQSSLLADMKITIKSGYYEGAQISLENYCDYSFLNKTNQKLIKSLFVKIAKKFHLYDYDLAYRFSNGKIGVNLVKRY